VFEHSPEPSRALNTADLCNSTARPVKVHNHQLIVFDRLEPAGAISRISNGPQEASRVPNRPHRADDKVCHPTAERLMQDMQRAALEFYLSSM
jgi:hypothetical protein